MQNLERCGGQSRRILGSIGYFVPGGGGYVQNLNFSMKSPMG